MFLVNHLHSYSATYIIGLMNTAFMIYAEGLAKLSTIANKQVMFYTHMLLRIEFHEDSKQMIVYLTPTEKRQIMTAINSESGNPLGAASQYINKLQQSGLIKSIGGSAYLINPVVAGLPKYIKNAIRHKNSNIYENRVFNSDGSQHVEAYIVTEDGERIDLT